ncbi:MAG TPA: cobalamin biosynthesis protein, partial [Alphaproteobacteria bacterium]|nr:cobalamin biosynthesis protein [Alphaproteobacteria bacterium]
MEAFLAPLALLLERLVGYPRPLFAAIRHPVVWMGALIDWLERRLNRGRGKGRGILALALLLAATAAITVPVTLALRAIPYGWIAEAVLATAFLAQKEL